ncbi:sigma-70 family RNA polymerase sigma factor [Tateyamaria sp. ANG-S1]|uniref:sigma-70 family RNA polymerase sigma factor n=1 Tax=Tateyamaria sp. ANG-S1 TaxID=1577905 RepID=UPI00068D84AE|nr:sigma-70 family RNA polymerase sigma factor [Tateyamaria sp. ANG-S1]
MAVIAELSDKMQDYVSALRRYALVLTRNRDAAEDLVQETLVKAIAAADSWDPESNLRVWLFRIMHNTHISAIRKTKVRDAAKPDLPEPVDHTDPTVRVELNQVLDALGQLPEAQRRPIILVALEDMSYAEAASVLDIPMGTLYSRLGRGRAALRKILDQKKEADPKVIRLGEHK